MTEKAWVGPVRPDAVVGVSRLVVAAFTVLPLLAVLAVTVDVARSYEAQYELSCWVLPNAYVLVTPGDERCPLHFNDRIRYVETRAGDRIEVNSSLGIVQLAADTEPSIRAGVIRDARLIWIDVPVARLPFSTSLGRLVSAGLVVIGVMWIPLLLLRRSSSRAVPPLAILFSLTGVVFVTAACSRHSEALTRVALFSMVVAPAIVGHLGFVFPRERKVCADSPRIALLPYAILLFLIPAGWFALDRDTVLWPTFMWLLLAMAVGAWAMLVMSCAFAIWESTSSVERARSRTVCLGATVLPLVPTLWLASDRAQPEEFVSSYLWISAVSLPWTIGLAISRYNLFDPGYAVRRRVGRPVYYLAAAGLVSVVLAIVFGAISSTDSLPDPLLLFVSSVACVGAMELARQPILGLLEPVFSKRLASMRSAREEFESKASGFHELDVIATFLADALRKSVGPSWGCVFLRSGTEWRAAAAFGERAPLRNGIAELAENALGGRRLVHVAAAADTGGEQFMSLIGENVEVAARIEIGSEDAGLVLLGERLSGDAYESNDFSFIAKLLATAGFALRSSSLAEGLVRAERQATMGRVALTVAHDVGKELDWMRRLVARLPERRTDRARFERDVAMIQEFAEGVADQMARLVRECREEGATRPGVVRCDDLIEVAVRRVDRMHHGIRVLQSVDPAVRGIQCHENVGRVVANLLDNAARASRTNDPIHLYATRGDGSVCLVVADNGAGMTDEVRRKAFLMGFTTRAESGGLGVGLTVSKEMIERLGGELTLEPNKDGGIRATVRVPITQEAIA